MFFLPLIVFFVTTVHSTSRISAPEFRAVNFAQAKERRKLNGSVIEQVDVMSEDECSLQCVGDEQCLSYNFGNTRNESGTFVCELSDSDRFFGFGNFTEDDNFTYRGMQSVCESSSKNPPCGDKGICIPDYSKDSFRCKCDDGYEGIPCDTMKDCSKLGKTGFSSNGVYHINPDGGSPMQVFCDLITNGSGWTVFQKRLDGSVDFFRNWESYKNGFGDPNGEFWLGNDKLHRLTFSDDVMLRVDMEDFDGNITYAEYTTFQVADEADKYRIVIGGYSGTAGDSLADDFEKGKIASNMQFSTKDADNDRSPHSCAQRHSGGWWFNKCTLANPNGLYHNGPYSGQYPSGAKWATFRGQFYSLKRFEMKLKPKG
ncbi:microfibril-associated glycoprotein 4-like [Porites lutea]|uniref:microfibril-associated glycoprotein 4-like n=1 Tax=Porites lutea TaxID=51062 RepID=UPI003CC64200